jgi:GDP-L-fucose synthase
MKKNSLIFVAGHNGMVGNAIVAILKKKGYTNLLLKSRSELNLLNQQSVATFFEKNKPEYVFLAAAKVGGIVANNTARADFIYENIVIEANIIHAAHINKVKKLLFLGSSCIYPKFANQPIEESSLLTGPLEQTNESYAIAKIAGIKMCEAYRDQYGDNFISAMPTNLYGQQDNYNLQNSHVLPAMIRKFYEAKQK